jgi:hypothetical protein
VEKDLLRGIVCGVDQHARLDHGRTMEGIVAARGAGEEAENPPNSHKIEKGRKTPC